MANSRLIDVLQGSRTMFRDQIVRLASFGPERPGTQEGQEIRGADDVSRGAAAGDALKGGVLTKNHPSNGEDRHSVSLAILNASELTGRGRGVVVEALSRGSDYLVRVHMNTVLLRLDPEDEADQSLALGVLDDLLSEL